MKKYLKVILIMALMLLGIGVLLIAGAYGLAVAGSKAVEGSVLAFDVEGVPQTIIVDADYGNVLVRSGKEFKVTAENIAEDCFSVTFNEGILNIKRTAKKRIELLGWKAGYCFTASPGKPGNIIVMIPEDQMPSNFRIIVTAGSVTAQELSAVSFAAQIGAGWMSLRNLNISEATALQVSLGVFEADMVETPELSLFCFAGDLDLHTQRPVDEYDLELTCRCGRLAKGKDKYWGFNRQYFSPVQAGSRITVNNVLGTVDVY